MVQCLQAYREYLLGVSTLIPHCVRGDRSGLSMVPPKMHGLWDSAGGFEEQRFFNHPYDWSLCDFLHMWNVYRPRGRGTG